LIADGGVPPETSVLSNFVPTNWMQEAYQSEQGRLTKYSEVEKNAEKNKG
jgi:hypothetical protein